MSGIISSARASRLIHVSQARSDASFNEYLSLSDAAPRRVQCRWSRQCGKSTRVLLVESEFLGQFEFLRGEFFDVDVLEREHAHGLHKAVRAVNVPDPDVLHG